MVILSANLPATRISGLHRARPAHRTHLKCEPSLP